MLKVMEKGAVREASRELCELDEIALAGARRMLMAALKTEAADYVERHRDERDVEGRALVVHNGRSKGRKLTLGAGTVELKAPRVNDRRHDEQGQCQRFSSRILPPYMRRSPKVAEVLPILYLRGLSARRSCSRSRMATGRAPRAGRRCCATSSGAGWPVVAVGDGALGFWAA